MAALLEKLRSLFSSTSTTAVTDKRLGLLPSYVRNEDAEAYWLTSDLIGDGAYGKIFKVYYLDVICWTVLKMTTVTTNVAVEVMGRTPEEESLEVPRKRRHSGCGRDMLGQTVPSTGSGRARLPTVDSHVRWTVSDSEEAE